MPRLLRVHFASVGHPDARLAPLSLDFRHGDGTGADSLIWLRNGGGKSSILNLFFSVFRPDRRDFLGAKAEAKVRHLQDYIKDSDLAFVLTEWDVDPPDTQVLFTQRPNQTRLVGQLLSWRGQQRSSDASRLRRLFFTCRLDETLRFDDLPVQGLGTPVTSFEAFREWLSSQRTLEPQLTEHQDNWQKLLDDLGLDTELFAYQIKMNLREGAADEQFRFGSPREFIDFFLQLALNTDHAELVSENLATLSDQFKRRPGLMLEGEFIDAVMTELAPLVLEIVQMRQARQAKQECLQRVGEVASALVARAQVFSSAAEQTRRQVQEAADAITQAYNEHRKLTRWADGLTRRARELEVEEASRLLLQAKTTELAAERTLKTTRAASQLHALRTCEAQVTAIQDALRKSELALEPLKKETAQAGARLFYALKALIVQEQQRLKGLKTELESTAAQLKGTRQEEAQVRIRQGSTTAFIQSLKQKLDERDQARDKLLQLGTLEAREDADGALERWKSRQNTLAAQLEGAETEQQRLETLRTDTQTALDALNLERTHVKLKAQPLEVTLQEAASWQERILLSPTFLDQEGLGHDVSFLTPRTRQLLEKEAQQRRRDIIQLRLDRMEDDRALESLARTGFLPPSRDTEVVLERLKTRAIPAHSGLEYLVQNCPEGERSAFLLRDPARFAGVVVTTERVLEQVRALPLPWAGLRGPLQVSLPRLERATLPSDSVVLAPESAGTYDRSAADVERARLEDRGRGFDQKESQLNREEKAYQSLANDLGRYLERFPEGRIEALEQELSALKEKSQGIESLSRDLQQQREETTRRMRQLTGTVQQLRIELKQVGERVRQLETFFEQHERKLPQLRTDLEKARADERALEQQAEALKQALIRWEGQKSAQEEVLRRGEYDLGALEREQHAITFRDPSTTDSGDTLEEARARYERLASLLRRETSENKLHGQLEAVEKQRMEKAEEYRVTAVGLEPAAIEALMPLSPLAVERAEAVFSEAGRAVGKAEAGVEEAKRRLAELKSLRRDADDLPPDFIQTTAQVALELAERHREGAKRALEAQAQAKERHIHLEAEVKQREAQADASRRQRKQLEIAVDEIPAVPPGALPEHDAEIELLVDELSRRFKSLKEKAQQAEDDAGRRVGKVHRVVNEGRFEALRTQYRERLKASGEEGFWTIQPAHRWYERLLERAEEVFDWRLLDSLGENQVTMDEDVQSLDEVGWLPRALQPAVRALFAQGRRLPQELVGWEVLVASEV